MKAETITVRGYDPFDHQEGVDVTLHIKGKPPDHHPLNTETWFDYQAALVSFALLALPQGTRQRVLVRLLKQHRNIYMGKDPAATEPQG